MTATKRKRKWKARLRSGRQCAALALATRDGELRVLLVTSRETRRWVLPKGWIEDGVAPHEQAAREAYEEAGLRGDILPEAVGRYAYRKLMPGDQTVTCAVDVYPLLVRSQLGAWPEQRQRETQWFGLRQAAAVVAEDGLASLLLALASFDDLRGGVGPV